MGKFHFGYIFGLGGVGCIGMWCILNLMSDNGVDVYRVISVLGYCMLPLVFLAALCIFISIRYCNVCLLTNLGRSPIGFASALLVVAWCTYSAAAMFVKVLSMIEQRLLVAYPVAMLYTCFALLTLF